MQNRNTVNKVILMGRIGKEPRLHHHSGQRSWCFPLVTVERFRNGQEMQLHEEWHNIRVSDLLADAERMRKGAMVYIQGRLKTSVVVEEDGIKRYRSEVVAVNVELLDVQLSVVS